LTTRETVERLTPATAATSFIVGRRAEEIAGELDNVFSVPDGEPVVKTSLAYRLPLDGLGGLG